MTESVAGLRAALSDRYAIEREIGHGGMATVYLARDLRHGRKVALKVLRPELRTAIGTERFLREIRTTAQLTHPHILAMHDSGEVAGLLYYIMPYIEGESLRDRLNRDRRLSVDAALDITLQIADALAYAHAHAVIHRDIKPENILFSGGDHVWVSDFGLARALHSAANESLTSSGIAVGSPRYMSPEQAAGERTVDVRSDIYSLACVTYEMLAGVPPFAGENVQALIARHIAQPAPLVSAARPDVPEHVSGAVAKAMAKDPAARFAKASDFARALDPSARSISYRRSVALPLRMRFNRIRRSVWIATVAGIVIIAAAGFAAWRGGYSLAGVFHSGASASSGRRIVVTPLENRTGSPALNAVGVMVADWITSGLQRVRAVEVVPTPTALQAFRFVTRDSSSPGAERDPVAAVASETGANIVVTGAVYRRGDRLLFRLQVTDVGQKKLVETLDDVEAPLADPVTGVEEMRARLMGWFAGQYDERIRAEMSQGARPPVYQAYVAFTEGLDHYIANDYRAALPRFLEAYKADSSFTASLIYASLCFSNMRQRAQSDSLLKIIERSRLLLSDYDRAWLDYREAFLAGRHEAALTAIRTATQLAPDSKSAYNYALTTFESGHPQDALGILKNIPPERGPMRRFLPYWDLLASVQHVLGRYDIEHNIGLIERRLYPDRLFAFMPLVRSLAAQGRVDTLDLVLKDAEGFAPDQNGKNYGNVVVETAEELRAHGHPEASVQLFQRAQNWYQTAGRNGRNRWPLAQIAYALGRYRYADSIVSLLRAQNPDSVGYLGLKGLILTRLGAKVGARAVVDTLPRLRRPYQFGAAALYRARIAAVIGDRREAMARLRDAYREGMAYDLWYHRDADLESLRGYDVFVDPARLRK